MAKVPASALQKMLDDSIAAKALLQEALDKSAELVASLEAKVELLQTEVADVRKWWRQDQDTVAELREKLAAVKREPELMASLSHQRDLLQRQLDQCIGWMAHAEGKNVLREDPNVLSMFNFNNGSR